MKLPSSYAGVALVALSIVAYLCPGAAVAFDPTCEESGLTERPSVEGSPRSDYDDALNFAYTVCRPLTLSVEIRSPHADATVSFQVTDHDVLPGKSTVRRHGQFALTGVGIFDNQGAGIDVTFIPTVSYKTRAKYSYAIRVDGNPVRTGSFRIRVRSRRVSQTYEGVDKIWEGTDRFFNYCLKKDKELTSQGGRLYCWGPVSYKVTHRRSYRQIVRLK